VIRTESLGHVYSKGTPFEKVAIKDITLGIGRGQVVGLIGHTGSGKSTFIQHLNGLLTPTTGRVLYEGGDVFASKTATRDVRFKVGLVFQYPEYQLFEETVYRDIAFGPKNMKLPAAEIDERVREAARFVGVPDELFERSPLELSGGQKRRIAIAGVIAMRPGVLILDEPTAGLDPAAARIFSATLSITGKRPAPRSFWSPTIWTTRRGLPSGSLLFSEGGVVMDGTPEDVFSRADELIAMGLDVPEPTSIAKRLREKGVRLPESVYTTEQLRDAVLAARCAVNGGDAPC
jgi:energy-coupling factor transport system ATP-binding protein